MVEIVLSGASLVGVATLALRVVSDRIKVEQRLSRIETKVEMVCRSVSELRTDVKDILKALSR